MAERTEILAIKLDAEGALKEITEIGVQLLRVKENKKALEEAYKSGTKTEQEYVRGMAEIKAESQALTAQQNAYQRTLTAAQTLLKQNTGSIEENRARLSGLTAEYIKLSKEERENSEVGKKMQKEIRKLSDDLKEQEAAIGNTSRNVGNYKGAIMDAIGGMGGFGKAIEGIGTAVKANPLGLLLTAITLLPQLLKSSGEGADFFNKALSIMNAIVQEGLKRLVALGGAAVKIFTGDFKGAMIEGKAAIAGFGDAVTKAVKSGGELADRMDALENAESKFALTSEQAGKQIDELLLKAKNRHTSEADRIKLLEKAEKIEIDINKRALGLAEERLKLIKKENAINQADSDEQIKRVNEQETKITQIKRESGNIREKIQNRLDALEDAAAAKAAARIAEEEKAAKAAVDADDKRNEALEKNRKLAVETQKKIDEEAYKGSIEINKSFYDELDLKAKESYAKGDARLMSKEAFEKNALYLKAARMEAEIKIIENSAGKVEGIEKTLADKRIEYANFVADNQIAANDEKTKKAIANAEKEAEQTKVFIGQVQEIFTGALTEQGINLQKFQMGVLSLVLDTVEKQVQAAVVGSTATAVIGSMSTPDAILTLGATGFIRAAVLTGLIKAAFAVFKTGLTSLITSQNQPFKMAGGGYLEGASHSAGGIRGTGSFSGIEVEGGEIIINKRSAARFRSLLNTINIAGGGRNLMPSNYNAAGGILPDSTRSALGNINAQIDYHRLAQAINNLPAPVVVVKDIASGLKAAQVKESRINS